MSTPEEPEDNYHMSRLRAENDKMLADQAVASLNGMNRSTRNL